MNDTHPFTFSLGLYQTSGNCAPRLVNIERDIRDNLNLTNTLVLMAPNNKIKPVRYHV